MPEDTKERLKLVATEFFALHGFNGTSVRAICEKAQTNIGAINYHFGSKQGLYEAVVRDMSSDLSSRTKGIHLLATDQSSWEKALHDWVEHFLSLMLAPEEPRKWLSRLCSRELADPTPISGQLFATFFASILDEMRRLIQMGLQVEHSYDEEQCYVISVIAQCIFLANREPPWDQLVIPWGTPVERWTAEYGAHVVRSVTSRMVFRENPYLPGA